MTDLHNLDLQSLIQNAKQGDSAAIGELLERYRSYLKFKTEQEIGPKLRKRIDASDVVQVAFADACEDVIQFRGSTENEFSAWLQRILRNRLNNIFRDNRAAKRDANQENTWRVGGGDASTSICWMDPSAETPTPSQRMIQGERALRIATELEKLPESQRDAVRMRHLEGMNLADIASQLDRTLPATAGLIKRGMASLRDNLHDESLG